ncbi:hypothetical protein Fleli_1698 [Bernardetia litoralis DSM 6794]|uniref:Uncharacterized protein n=2 Tax=Bernardetia litoralis TaxID=999 RepID=I4AJH1_BERLS|nr:hypothetical protein Fleli_1698 [Bernardetia litoralis DSM 6794]
MFFVLAFMTISFTSCDEDDVVNYADDLPGTYENILAGDINVEGAINVITLSNKGDSEALTKDIIVEITDKTTETNAGVETVRYSTNNNDVDITRIEGVISITVTGGEYVQNVTNLYVGTKSVE